MNCKLMIQETLKTSEKFSGQTLDLMEDTPHVDYIFHASNCTIYEYNKLGETLQVET